MEKFSGVGLFAKPTKKKVPVPRAKKEIGSKVLVIYSGKGGVGKTTTTANIARSLSESGHRTMVIDMDVNTPSMPIIFPDPRPNDNLLIESLGYDAGTAIYVEQSILRQYIRTAIKKAIAYDPEYVLIDTPPSITDVHINLMKSIKISGFLLVTQPNDLSKSDVMRTMHFFTGKGIPVVGIVENMKLDDATSEYPVPLVQSIPFDPSFDQLAVYDANKERYADICSKIADIKTQVFENTKRAIMDESVTDLKDIVPNYTDRAERKTLRFINVSTWPQVREVLMDFDDNMPFPNDRFLSENTPEKVARFVAAFEDDEQAYFMITKAPNTGITLFPSEIGRARLILNETSYFSLPRIGFQTAKGELVLFPYEVMPATPQIMRDAMADGAELLADGRYIPSKDMVEGLYNAFGSLCGLSSHWEAQYDNLYS